jgi:hypothetical protein
MPRWDEMPAEDEVVRIVADLRAADELLLVMSPESPDRQLILATIDFLLDRLEELEGAAFDATAQIAAPGGDQPRDSAHRGVALAVARSREAIERSRRLLEQSQHAVAATGDG